MFCIWTIFASKSISSFLREYMRWWDSLHAKLLPGSLSLCSIPDTPQFQDNCLELQPSIAFKQWHNQILFQNIFTTVVGLFFRRLFLLLQSMQAQQNKAVKRQIPSFLATTERSPFIRDPFFRSTNFFFQVYSGPLWSKIPFFMKKGCCT